MHVHIYIYIYIYIRRTYIAKDVRACCEYICTVYICKYIYIYIYTFATLLIALSCIHAFLCTYLPCLKELTRPSCDSRAHMYIYVYVYMCAHTYIYTPMYMYTTNKLQKELSTSLIVRLSRSGECRTPMVCSL